MRNESRRTVDMDSVDAPRKPDRYNRLLPYWAVLQADIRQTVCSWVYLCWVLASVMATVGYLLYGFGIHHTVGIVQSASFHISQLLRWSVLGSTAFIVVLTAGSISGERGTMADSVLSRGISRYQYFLGKWHARLAAVLGTFFVLGLVSLISSNMLLHEDLTLLGGLVALATVATILAAIITCGVAVSAMASNTLLGISVLWMVLYGGGFLLALLPERFPSPDRSLQRLHFILQGDYDPTTLLHLAGWSALFCFLTACVGMGYFARRDV